MGGAGAARPTQVVYNPGVFTGLVQALGTVARVTAVAQGRRLRLQVELAPEHRRVGASVAVNGACLTVVATEARALDFDVGFETLERTELGALAAGDRVNVEPSLRIGDPLGGHLVSGHVDGVGRVTRTTPRGEALQVHVAAPRELYRFIAPKGSICVDGVSLTVNAVDDEGFEVGLVPHTLAVTTFSELRPGRRVNLEVDQVARYLARLVEVGGDASQGVSHELLLRAGFIDSPGRDP